MWCLKTLFVYLAVVMIADGAIDTDWYQMLVKNIEKCFGKEIGHLKRKFNNVNADYCHMYLISGYGRETSVMTASSSYDNKHGPHRGILYTEQNDSLGPFSSWSAKSNSQNDYLQVELPFISFITGIATQGRDSNTYKQWVKSYKVLYSIDCKTWKTVGNGQVFTGNSDENTVMKNMFAAPVTAKCIRIYPITYHGHMSIRMEVIGCKF